MPKINREEYEVLKALDDEWKWIARDEDRALWAYEDKPGKYEGDWVDLGDDCEYVGGQDFQFIQWEDEESYNIAELIEEYEYHNVPVKLAGALSITQAKYDKYLEEHIKELENESEETEVKKNIEWAKKQIDLRNTGTTDESDPQFYVDTGLRMALDFLNQLDEPEVEELEE